ncbi:MAG: PBP1A family penicillin-binding protein [Myxococcales bacterium]|nr:MAG: PBP1A family penicillin-binding protein [Myxococcales bacterium]
MSALPRKPTRKTAKRRSRGGGGRPRLRWWLKTAALAVGSVGFVAGFVFAGYVVRLDRSVRERFEGQRFRVPSRVYSAPSILYPGLDWKLVDLEGTLVRLGYRKVAATAELESGSYLWSPSRLRVQLRAFSHPSRPEPARDVVFVLRGSQIEEIRELPAGNELGAVLLEPEPIGAYYGPDREQRALVWLEDVPRHLVDAVFAVEDRRFESHHGIDPRRIAGAMLANLRAGRVAQGGSTLTQQLVKNFFLTPERTVRRKVQEGVMALLVEVRYEKREILQAYLNEIYFGQRGATAAHGVGEASKLYFGKTAANLSVAESALLAAIIQSPNGKSPYRDPERAVERRNLVLELMHRQGRISEAALQRARQEPLRLAAVTPDPGDARFFLDLLQRQLASSYSSEVLETEGLRIYSTLDRRAQRIAADALREGIESLEKRYPRLRSEDPRRALQGCIVALRPQTGEVIALVGGRDYSVTQFDRCSQARRQTGSVFKPFVYIAALEPRPGGPFATLASFVDDSPLEVRTPSGPWRPANFDHKFHGPVPLREALERSYNTATARLAQDVGIARVIDVAKRMGISSDLPAVPSLALGTAIVSPLEVARAYATLASGGIRPEVQAAEDLVNEDGEILQRRRLRFERVLDPGTAFLATSLLQGVADRGTAAGLRAGGLRGPIAAKTGTTTAEHDLWLVGYTPELVAVVWLGFDEPRSLGIPSSQGALPIWRRFVEILTGGEIRGAFRPPPGIETADIDPRSGALASWGCPERRSEYFLAGTLPVATCPAGGVAGRRRDRNEEESVERGFLEWLRRQL